ncbi:hypothetical protein CALCODRAFT_492078 [Calocera cornea HHB12733]|uniref:F-box domain-containing protein n=1 Tax=Calocera cornea HHB12733 TaxID=1353952 RepID=A0A165INU2_9BASI|nr:hypothetical protein CALCODRAFT_492078 [Calocera cornea HHB12733]
MATLLSCHQLEELRLRYYLAAGPFRISDSDFESMAEAWPNLEKLSICWRPKQPTGPDDPIQIGGLHDETAISLTGARGLFTTCVHLTSLHVTSLHMSALVSTDPALTSITRDIFYFNATAIYRVTFRRRTLSQRLAS